MSDEREPEVVAIKASTVDEFMTEYSCRGGVVLPGELLTLEGLLNAELGSSRGSLYVGHYINTVGRPPRAPQEVEEFGLVEEKYRELLAYYRRENLMQEWGRLMELDQLLVIGALKSQIKELGENFQLLARSILLVEDGKQTLQEFVEHLGVQIATLTDRMDVLSNGGLQPPVPGQANPPSPPPVVGPSLSDGLARLEDAVDYYEGDTGMDLRE